MNQSMNLNAFKNNNLKPANNTFLSFEKKEMKPNLVKNVLTQSDLNYFNYVDSLSLLNKAGIQNQISFGATFWAHIKDGALVGGAGGGTAGAGVDLITGGTSLGAGTLVGGALGAIGGAIAGAADYVSERNHRRRLEQMVAERERLNFEKVKFAAQQEELNEAITKADAERKKSLEEAQKLLDEQIRIHAINEAYNTKALNEVRGFGIGKIAGYNEDKVSLNRAFISPFLKSSVNPAIYENVPNGVLFYGLTGNGKTTMAIAIAEQVLGDKVKTNFYNLSNKKAEYVVTELNNIKEKAGKEFNETGQRSIIFIDEFDGIALEENKNGYNPTTNGMLKSFLNDCSEYGITVIATTNHPRNIEEAFIKNDRRFSVKTLLEPPSNKDIADILCYYLDGVADSTVDYKVLTNHIESKANAKNGQHSGAKIEAIANKAKDIAKDQKRLVNKKDLLEVIQNVAPDLSIASFNKFNEDFNYMMGSSYDEYLARKKDKIKD